MPEPRVAEDDPTDLGTIDRGECLRLLSTANVGRVIYSEAAMPAAHPVKYVVDGDEIVFRTLSRTKIALAVQHRVLAFQLDQINPDDCTGWSVLGIGQAYLITDPWRLAALASRMPQSWVRDRAARTVSIPLARLTGRCLAPST
jgi:nitroimidazol reductase NimA-like FMN-containing flavoprotein (pyridoxamine 5'-phosphate oxidase superfamily)